MLTTIIIVLFLAGYLAIAFEHALKVNKASVALIVGVVTWVIYAIGLPELASVHHSHALSHYLSENPSLQGLSLVEQCRSFITNYQIKEVLGEISETLFFLIGAMTIVEVVDVHGGFGIITNRITARRKTSLLWVISIITFFLSSLLDNMTTAIVMVMLIRRIISNYKERWVYASIIIIAANSGGAWSPIGDITTIMLWVKGNITAGSIIPSLMVPCIVSCLIPTYIGARFLHGLVQKNADQGISTHAVTIVSKKESMSLSIISILSLVSVPIFKSVTHLPPFMGILLALGVVWIYTEIIYSRKVGIDESLKHRVPTVLRHIDTPTILFFLGILMAVSSLQAIGILGGVAATLDSSVHNVYLINAAIGVISSIVDNVPLVAASIAMYPMADGATVAACSDPAYMSAFVQDGIFWQLLAYCAGVGGSMLIIGSVSGVIVMGLEKINFMWYTKNISILAFSGYVAGILTYILQNLIFG